MARTLALGIDHDLEKTRSPGEDVIRPRRAPLTQQVSTRWYRAPEVILLQEYDHSVDVWGLGCTFAELLRCANSHRSSKVLFKGDSCFPISPCKGADVDGDINLVDTEDQLLKILSVVGNDSKSFEK